MDESASPEIQNKLHEYRSIYLNKTIQENETQELFEVYEVFASRETGYIYCLLNLLGENADDARIDVKIHIIERKYTIVT